jgi:hypothetical protein
LKKKSTGKKRAATGNRNRFSLHFLVFKKKIMYLQVLKKKTATGNRNRFSLH